MVDVLNAYSDTVPWQQTSPYIQIRPNQANKLFSTFRYEYQCNVNGHIYKMYSPHLCMQTSCDLCIFGYIVFWHVIYGWTMELTVIDAMEK